MNAMAGLLILQASVLLPASAELTREQAEAALARITEVYLEASHMSFVLDVEQEPTGAHRIHCIHTRDFVWFAVENKGKQIYQASAVRVDATLPPEKSVGTWILIDKNYTLDGAMSVFSLENEEYHAGWHSENDANMIRCFTHTTNRPIVGPRSKLVRVIDHLLGTRADLLPDREYMETSEYVPFLREGQYIGPDFPTDEIVHIWRRPAGRARAGNPGTDMVTLCMKNHTWIVLRRMTVKGNDLTVRDTWKVDPKSGLIVRWDRDFGHDLYGYGRVRTWKFTYQTDDAPGVTFPKQELPARP